MCGPMYLIHLVHHSRFPFVVIGSRDIPLFINGSLLSACPPGNMCFANGSSRYPHSTALSLEVAASRSVPWMILSLSTWEIAPASPGPPLPLPRPLPPPRRSVLRLGICEADIEEATMEDGIAKIGHVNRHYFTHATEIAMGATFSASALMRTQWNQRCGQCFMKLTKLPHYTTFLYLLSPCRPRGCSTRITQKSFP